MRQWGVGFGGGLRGHFLAVALVDDDRRTERIQQPGPFPVGQVPAHGDGDGADLPAGQRNQDELEGVGDGDSDQVAKASSAPGQNAGPAVGAAIDLIEREATFDAVDGHHRQRE